MSNDTSAITNYSDFFFKAMETRVHRAVTHLNYTEAYVGFSDENSSVCIMDGSAYGPHFCVLFSEAQHAVYNDAGWEHSENVFCAWEDALARLYAKLLEGAGPEGVSYFLNEEEGCVYVMALDENGEEVC